MAKDNKMELAKQKGDTIEAMRIHNQEIDTPILPIDHIEKLYKIRPDIIDWLLKETEIEAKHRRQRNNSLDCKVFIERILGQTFGFLIGILGIAAGAIVAIKGFSKAGCVIASIAIGTLAVNFLKREK